MKRNISNSVIFYNKYFDITESFVLITSHIYNNENILTTGVQATKELPLDK